MAQNVFQAYGSHSEVIAKVEEAMEAIGGRIFSIEKSSFMTVTGVGKGTERPAVSSLGYIHPAPGRYMNLMVQVMIKVEEFPAEENDLAQETK